MSLGGTRELLDAAASAGFAVPAFNVITLEHAEAIVDGAERAGTAVLLQLSENAVNYHGALEPILAVCRELAKAASVPVALHLDHIEDPALVQHALAVAAEFGLSSIMFDASRLDYEANVEATRAVVERAHSVGLWVEAELGTIGGKDGAHAPGVRTDPGEALSFVSATGVDALAVAVGSSHAMTERTAAVDIELVARLSASVDVPLVLHGSSGVPDQVLGLAVAAGIRKVNLGTALNVAATAAVRRELDANPTVVDPRRYWGAARAAMAERAEHYCRVVAGAH